MTKKFTQPKNTEIKISALGEEKTFVSGNKNWRIDFADYKGKRFEPGVSVSWTCQDERKSYKGKIEWMILIDTGDVDVSIDNLEVGRLPLDELRFVKKAPKRTFEIKNKAIQKKVMGAAKREKTGNGFMVFNYTDNIYASPDVFPSKSKANEFIREFRKRFEIQGYYRNNRMEKVALEDIDVLAIPTDFNPLR